MHLRRLLKHASQNHDYVLVFIQGSDTGTDPLAGDIWVRCERHPDATSLRAFLSFTSPNASDTITMSFDKTRVTNPDHQPIGVAVRQRATFRHLVRLLGIVSDVSHTYGLASANCWWFARVVFTTLDVYNGGETMIAPQGSFTKEMVKSVGKKMENETKDVGDRFAALYPETYLTDSPEAINVPLPEDEQDEELTELEPSKSRSSSLASSTPYQVLPFADASSLDRPPPPPRTLTRRETMLHGQLSNFTSPPPPPYSTSSGAGSRSGSTSPARPSPFMDIKMKKPSQHGVKRRALRLAKRALNALMPQQSSRTSSSSSSPVSLHPVT